jgi:hypothetical protein
MPGNIDSHHALASLPRPSATIWPQEGVGGGIPAPRKLRDASTMMTNPMCSVSNTMKVLRTFGRICTVMMRRCEQPRTCARAIKSRDLMANTSPRTTRAKRAHKISATAMTTVRKPAPEVIASKSANEDRRKRQSGVNRAHQQPIQSAADVSGENADDQSDPSPGQERNGGDGQADPCPMEETGEQIASE